MKTVALLIAEFFCFRGKGHTIVFSDGYDGKVTTRQQSIYTNNGITTDRLPAVNIELRVGRLVFLAWCIAGCLGQYVSVRWHYKVGIRSALLPGDNTRTYRCLPKHTDIHYTHAFRPQELCLCQLKQNILEEGDMFRFSCDVSVHPQNLLFDPIFFAVTKGDVMTGLAINTEVVEPNSTFQLHHFFTGPENRTFVIEISKRVTLTDTGNYTCGTKIHYHKTETLKVIKGDIGHISLTLRKIDKDVISGREVTVNRDSGTPDLPLQEVNLTSGSYRLVCTTRRQDLSISYVILINGIKVARSSSVDVDLGSEDRNVACRVRTTDKFTDTHTVGVSTNVHEGIVPIVSCQSNFWVKGKQDQVECRVTGVACEAISLNTDMSSTGKTNDATVLSCQTNRTTETLSSILQISDTRAETLFIIVRSQQEDFRFEIKTGLPLRYDALASTADSTGSHYSFVFKAIVTTLLMLPIATILEMVIM